MFFFILYFWLEIANISTVPPLPLLKPHYWYSSIIFSMSIFILFVIHVTKSYRQHPEVLCLNNVHTLLLSLFLYIWHKMVSFHSLSIHSYLHISLIKLCNLHRTLIFPILLHPVQDFYSLIQEVIILIVYNRLFFLFMLSVIFSFLM